MSDNEVIKALKNCLGNKMHKCSGCCFISEGAFCENVLLKHTLDLINRLQAEIERLRAENKEKTETIVFLKDQAVGWSIDFCNLKKKLKTAKSEARKEFAERLKDKAKQGRGFLGNAYSSVDVDAIDNLLAELDGKENSDER